MKILLIINLLYSFKLFAQITVCHKSAIKTLDVHSAKNKASVDATHLKIYEPLVKRVGQKKTIIPLLVTKWDNSSDHKEWSFELRKNIKFQKNKFFTPTRYLNSEDVIFSLNRSKNINNLNIKKIIKNDNLRFKIILKDADPNYLEKLTSSKYAILSKEYFDFLKKKNKTSIFHKLPIGNGPFQIKNYKKESYINLTAFNEYHFGKVLYSDLRILSIKSNKKRMDMLSLKECHLSSQFSWDDLYELKKDQSLLFLENGPKDFIYLIYHTKNKKFLSTTLSNLSIGSYQKLFKNFTWKSKHIINHKKKILLYTKKDFSSQKNRLISLLMSDFSKNNFELVIKETSNIKKAINSDHSLGLLFINFDKDHTLKKFYCQYNIDPKRCKSNKLDSSLEWKKLLDTNYFFVSQSEVLGFYPQIQKAQDYSTIYLKDRSQK